MIIPAVIGLTLTALAVVCTTGSRLRRTMGVVLGVAVMLPPWLLPERQVLLRSVWALVAFTTTMRVVDLRNVDWPLGRRVVHVLSVLDSRRLVRARPRLDLAAFARIVAWSCIVAASVIALAHLAPKGGTYHVARWGVAGVMVYSAVSALYDLLGFSYGALGFVTPPLHVAPIRARSIRELWGERWARPINEWLRDTFFKPLARRRRPIVGLILAFMVSAAFHAYAVWVGFGIVRGFALAASMFGYFVAQAIVMLLERALRVERWAPLSARVWTITWMVALAPLFLEPLVQTLDVTLTQS